MPHLLVVLFVFLVIIALCSGVLNLLGQTVPALSVAILQVILLVYSVLGLLQIFGFITNYVPLLVK